MKYLFFEMNILYAYVEMLSVTLVNGIKMSNNSWVKSISSMNVFISPKFKHWKHLINNIPYENTLHFIDICYMITLIVLFVEGSLCLKAKLPCNDT